MSARLVAAATLPSTCTRLAGGRRCPRCHIAETAAASKPASRETSTCDCVKCRFCWTSESSTVPSTNVFARGPRGGGGGAAAVVVVAVDSRVVESLVVAPVVVAGVVVPRPRVVVAPPAEVPPPLPPESTTARITPPTAAAATTAASTAFFTGSEATLARPWLHTSKSS
jgi:hypothetical protein